jgi:hypothetical protein
MARRMRKQIKPLDDYGSGEIKPTGERRRQARGHGGDIVRAEPERQDPKTGSLQVIDARGEPGSPFKVVDTLDAMWRANTITALQYAAAQRFREDCEMGGLTGIQAMPFERMGTAPGCPTDGLSAAKLQAVRSVVGIIEALGRDSLEAQAMMHVCAYGNSLNWWRASVRIRNTRASKCFKAALDEAVVVYRLNVGIGVGYR